MRRGVRGGEGGGGREREGGLTSERPGDDHVT